MNESDCAAEWWKHYVPFYFEHGQSGDWAGYAQNFQEDYTGMTLFDENMERVSLNG